MLEQLFVVDFPGAHNAQFGVMEYRDSKNFLQCITKNNAQMYSVPHV